MGPVQFDGEMQSAYRFRYAAYALKWLALLGAGLLMVLWVRPWANSPPVLLIVFAVYIGLGLGTLAALLATAGFYTGALWAGWLESNHEAEKGWSRVKATAVLCVFITVGSLAVYCVARGVATGETLAISRKGIKVRYVENELSFLMAMAFWLFAAASAALAIWKQVRRARAI